MSGHQGAPLDGHLGDEQFAELLTGDTADAAAQLHLAACAPCRQELAAVRFATGSFNELSMAWAQAEAPKRIHTPSRVSLFLGGRPMWGLGFATAVVAAAVSFGGSSPLLHGRWLQAHVAVANTANAELAQDNQLMESIDQELRYTARPVIPVSELRAPARHGQHHHASSPDPYSSNFVN